MTQAFVGFLFILSTASFIYGNSLLEPILTGPNIIPEGVVTRSGNPWSGNIVLGCLFETLNTVIVTCIGIFLFPALKKQSETAAIGYLVFRGLEGALCAVSAMFPLVLIPLSKLTADKAILDVVATALAQAHFMTFHIGMVCLALGSLFLCACLITNRQFPYILGLLGIMGYLALGITSVMSIGGYKLIMELYIPGAIFELAFPVWLIVRGFRDEVPADKK